MNIEETLRDQYQGKDSGYFQAERYEMLRYVPPGSHTILDVGCGSGNFSRLLKKSRPAEVWGVELDKEAAAIAASKLDRVICGAFDSKLQLPDQSFDCVIFNDVLEHMVDPFSALVYAKTLFRDGGVLVASIPNVRYFVTMWDLLVHRDWKYADWGVLDRTHLRFFTCRSIISTFTDLGYQVKSIEGINPIENVHPELVSKFRFFNRLLFNGIEDMRYLQFAVVAYPQKS
ncbi:MAG TPA: class I SAM-dependent methyltransferase [Cyanobacteria bacterium UBA8803]|nr:class I SAM-dependent methyltransferase [Cyanobacteria bacterium UBA9273]HBL61321.1 class I SAM-dependent methyltransferase [Cyanobacteria bacterium UBA8803]